MAARPPALSEERERLAREIRALLAPYAHHRTFEAGTLLWREGDDAGMLVALESGRVKIFRVLPTGSAVTIYLFGPGDVFGFMPFLDGRPYPVSAQALDEATALVVSRTDLRTAFERDPQVALALVKLLATRLREAFDRIERSSVPEVLPRVAAALTSLLPQGPDAGPLVVLELPVRAREFAAAIGVAPESLSRAVTKLVEAGCSTGSARASSRSSTPARCARLRERQADAPPRLMPAPPPPPAGRARHRGRTGSADSRTGRR